MSIDDKNIKADNATREILHGDSPTTPGRTSKLAIFSLILGILGFLIPVFMAFIGLIFGVIGLRKINKSQGALKGRTIAISGTIVSAASLLLWLLPVFALSGYMLYVKATTPVFKETGGYSIVCIVVNDEHPDNSMIDQVCTVLKNRIDPRGVLGVIIRHKEERLIEICVPVCKQNTDYLNDPENLFRMLKGLGALEFRILPIKGDEFSNITELTARETELQEKGPKQASTSKYVWLEVENPAEFDGRYESGMAVIGTFGERTYVLASNQKSETMLHGSGEKKWKMRKAMPTVDRNGRRAISFRNDQVAATLFYKLTSANTGRPLCIILDNQAISAPVLQSAISKEGIITGQFTQQEVVDMVNKLNAGTLPVPVMPIKESIEWTSPGEK